MFVAALAVPFMRPKPVRPSSVPPPAPETAPDGPPDVAGSGESTWTGAVRRMGLRSLPPTKLLPDYQPAYVASWAYVDG